MKIEGRNDIEQAVFLLREIEAFLCFNIQPPKDQMSAMKETIKEFISHFPHCWDCGDTGYSDPLGDRKCHCCNK